MRSLPKASVNYAFNILLYYENAKEIRLAHQDLCNLWTTFHLAKKMGESLGRGKILFG